MRNNEASFIFAILYLTREYLSNDKIKQAL